MAGGISEVGFESAVVIVNLTPARTWACIPFDAESLRAVLVKHSESSCSRVLTFLFASENAMFSRENSNLQMVENAHVNERKHASKNQHPVGDDVSPYNRCAAARVYAIGPRRPFRDGTTEHTRRKLQKARPTCSIGGNM
jgi:hypothetical protein